MAAFSTMQHLKSKRAQRGQSMAELAISMMLLLILFTGIIDLGWAFFTVISLRESAQEAASFGSICPDNIGGIRDRLRNSSTFPADLASIPDGQITVCIFEPGSGACGAAPDIGNQIRVTVSYNHSITTPIIGSILGVQQYPITVSATNSILQSTCPAGL